MGDALKTSRMRRALGLGRLGATVALKQGRRLLARDETAVHAELARALVAELGELKGLPMKIGQILSYMDGVVPDEHQALYREILGELRTHSTPMRGDAWREVIEEELGASPEALFDEVDPEPIAAASIGQVHRAVLDGAPVVVKVQYPGIAEATQSDLANVDGLIGLMRTLMPNVDTRQMIEDFRARLAEECDYRIEAGYQARFAEVYADDPDVFVPEVVPERSGRRVLTSRFVEGRSLEAFVGEASRAERDRMGRALYRFAFGTLIQHGLFHADPHPGNLLFSADDRGRLCVLDYGCVQPIDAEACADIAALLRAAVEGRELGALAMNALGVSEVDDVTREATVRIVERVLAPVVEPQPFRFTPGFAMGISKAVIDAKLELSTRYLTRRGRLTFERDGVMFVVRNLFGLASIWGTLEAEGDYRALTSQLIEPWGQGTPLGRGV